MLAARRMLNRRDMDANKQLLAYPGPVLGGGKTVYEGAKWADRKWERQVPR